MKNILHLGCSWSAYNQENQKCIAQHAIGIFKNFNVEVSYYTAAHGGCDLGTQIEVLKEELNKNYDFIVFQITTANRHHIRINNLPIEWIAVSPTTNIYKCDVWLRKNFVFWNPNFQQAISKHWPIKQQEYISVAEQNYSYDYDDQSLFFGQLCMVKKLLQKSNKPYLIYTHRKTYWEHHNKLYYDHINDIIDFDIEDSFKSNFNKFVIDNGHHFNSEGNRIIVEDILVPKMLPYL